MVFEVRPILTVFEPLLVAYPIGLWDKREFLEVCRELKIEVTLIIWGFGVTAYQFKNLQEYTEVITYIYSKQAFKRWNK